MFVEGYDWFLDMSYIPINASVILAIIGIISCVSSNSNLFSKFCNEPRMELWKVFLIGAGALSGLICLITLIALIIRIYKVSNNKRPNKISLKMTYTAISLFVTSMLFYCFPWTYTPNPNRIVLFDIVSTVSWNLAQFIVYLLLFERVYHAFNNTKYSVSKYTVIWFMILSFAYLSSVVVYILWDIQAPNSNSENVFGDIYSIGEEVIDLILSVYMIAIFMNKLFQLTVDLAGNDLPEILTIQQQRLIHIMTKYFILSFIATLVTQLESLIYCFAEFSGTQGDYKWILYVSFLLWPIDCAVNSICLFLIFDINERLYIKSCGKFHTCIKTLFNRRIKRKLTIVYSADNVELEINLLDDNVRYAQEDNSIMDNDYRLLEDALITRKKSLETETHTKTEAIMSQVIAK